VWGQSAGDRYLIINGVDKGLALNSGHFNTERIRVTEVSGMNM